MRSFVRGLAAILEIAAVFIAGALLVRLVRVSAGMEPWLPTIRIVLILAVAAAVDLLRRSRVRLRWGLSLGPDGVFSTVVTSLRLLVIGGLPALAMTALAGSQSIAISFSGLLLPVLAQEVFVLGYAHARLSDRFSPRVTAAAVVVIFIAAHAQHAGGGPFGIAFLVAMAWQGLWWSAARSAGKGIIPLMVAHSLLLLLYAHPAAGSALLLGIGIIVFRGSRSWIASVWGTLQTRPAQPGTEAQEEGVGKNAGFDTP